MKRDRMSDPRREWYLELCHESGIDPQLPDEAYDDAPHPAPRRHRRERTLSRPRTYAEILAMWALAAFVVWYVAQIWVWAAVILIAGIVLAIIGAGALHRGQRDSGYIALLWGPTPAIAVLGALVVLSLSGSPLAPAGETANLPPGTDPAPTARPWFGPGGGGGGGPRPTAEVLRPTPDAAIVIVPTPLAVAAVDVAAPIAAAIAEAQPQAAAAGAQNAGQVAVAVVAGAYDAGQIAADTGAAMVSSAQAAGAVVVEAAEAVVDARAAAEAATAGGAPPAVGQAASGVVTAGEAAAGAADAAVDAAQPAAEAVATAQPSVAEAGAKNAGDAAVQAASMLCWLIGCGE